MSTEIRRDDLTLGILVPRAFDVLSVADDEFDRGVVEVRFTGGGDFIGYLLGLRDT